MSCDTILSERNCIKLVYDGYVYYKAGTKNSWKCVEKGKTDCRARLIVSSTRLEIRQTGKIHNHRPNKGKELEKSHKHVNRLLEKASNSSKERFYKVYHTNDEYNLLELGNFYGITAYYCDSKRFELRLKIVNDGLQKGQRKINMETLKIMEFWGLSEMKHLLCSMYKNPNFLPNCDSQNPIYTYCLELLFDYKVRCFQELTPDYVQNLTTEVDFRRAIDMFLDQVSDDPNEKRTVRSIIPHINPEFLIRLPYKHECDCGEDVSNEIIHSISNYLVRLGYVSAIYYDDLDRTELLKQGKICKHGRFRDANAFRRYLYRTQLYMQSNPVRTACVCNKPFLNNGVHSIWNWMLSNELITERDVNWFYEMKSPLLCPGGRMVLALDMFTFLRKATHLFQEYPEEDMEEDTEEGNLYFAYCNRVRPDKQGAVICRTSKRIVHGISLFQGMEHRIYFLYKGNQEAVQRILDNLERSQLPIDFSWSRVAGPSTSRQFFQN